MSRIQVLSRTISAIASLATFLLLIGDQARATTIEITSISTENYVVAVSTESVFDTLVLGVDGDVSEGVNVVPLNDQLAARVLTSTTSGFRLLTPLGAPDNEGVFEPGISHAIDLTYGVTSPVPGEWIDGLDSALFISFRLQSGVAAISLRLLHQGTEVEATTSSFPLPMATGDYNLDGLVDGADFLAIQRGNPSLISVWQTQYGSGSALLALSQQVPEPTTLVLITLCTLAAFGYREVR
ncbi:hypothetical protein [Adhaeretor mobilis]|uniref:PEP-CTERM protein-sorting domain-containing protein n=1 Tax=Adhaeretor mobilis TaxID=1930276 RepID=A0A517N1J9_9BACT|nr:hypothetical protein [Adhaeretor mobilis]QDT01010.1 hypothetical protein HG15A2_43520 [Adhaeretor mobilis]